MAWKTADEAQPTGVTLSFEGSSIAYPDGITREEIVEFSKNKGLGQFSVELNGREIEPGDFPEMIESGAVVIKRFTALK